MRSDDRRAAGCSLAAAALLVCAAALPQDGELAIDRADVVVYGGTPAGVMAAVAAARSDQRVMLIEPGRWIGGMMSGGLSNTDTGQRGAEVISGLAGEFFDRVRRIEEQRNACIDDCASTFFFEPQIAERVFEDMLRESNVIVERSLQISDVVKAGTRIEQLQTTRGPVTGAVFIDASYEGDLMALADIPYRIGREARSIAEPGDEAALEAHEEHAGVQAYLLPAGLHIDPYLTPADPASGTIAWIEPRPDPLPVIGSADHRVTAYTWRLCVTDDPQNRIPFTRPASYDPRHYALHARFAAAATEDVNMARALFNPAPVTRSRDSEYFKYDLNSSLTLSTDLTGDGLNQGYVEAAEPERAMIRQTYKDYVQGLLYALRTDARFAFVNERVARFGYCADEFTTTAGWPHQFYVRVGRRMAGVYDMNENDVMQNGRRVPVRDAVAYGSYALAAHSHRYFAAPVEWPDGALRDAVVLEGLVIGRLPNDAPYPIAWRSLLPRPADSTNLLNPVTLSATSVAYSSIRMEPTFMMLGEAAGAGAAIAAEGDINVQSVDYDALRARLLDNGVVLDVD